MQMARRASKDLDSVVQDSGDIIKEMAPAHKVFLRWSEDSGTRRVERVRRKVEDRAGKHAQMAEWPWYKHSGILMNILSRLPLLLLIQCQCVCKDWNMTIRDHQFFKIWLWRNSAVHKCILFLDNLFLSRSILLYSASSEKWFMKEVNIKAEMASKGFESSHWQISKQTAEGLVLCIGSTLPATNNQNLWNNLVVFNPITNHVRRLARPGPHGFRLCSKFSVYVTSATILQHRGPSHKRWQGGTNYKVLLSTFDGLNKWMASFQLYDSNSERWRRVRNPRVSCQYHTSGHEGYFVTVLRVEEILSKKNILSFLWALLRSFTNGQGSQESKRVQGSRKLDCIELLQYDSNYSTIARRTFPVCPWSKRFVSSRSLKILVWARSKLYPRFFDRIFRINDSLILPVIEVCLDNKCQTISISVLQDTSSSEVVDIQTRFYGHHRWATEYVMPLHLFETLHGASEAWCHKRQFAKCKCVEGLICMPRECTKQRCMRGLICVSDECTKQLLFVNNETSTIVAFRYRESFPVGIQAMDNPWVYLSHPLGKDSSRARLSSKQRFVEGLRSLSMSALVPDFEFRLDSVP